MRDTGIENGTGTTEKGVWLEANVFLMDLHLLTLIRTKGRRPIHPSPFLQTPNPLQTPREYPLPYRIEDCLTALPIPHLLSARRKNLKTLWGGRGGRQEENMSRPLVSIENGALSKETYEFLILQEQFSGEVDGKTSFPKKMDPPCRICLGE